MIREVRIPEVPPVGGRRLGRHVAHDDRSWAFQAERAPVIVDVDHMGVGLPLDQGNYGSCTANALVAAGNTKPNFRGTIRGEKDALEAYAVEVTAEGGTFPPDDPGGSGLEVCKAGVRLGWLTGYQHAFGLQHALQALVKRPVITGVNWYDSMDAPDSSGVVRITPGAQVRGGHELAVFQVVVARKLVGLWQSWGPDVGLGGRIFMSWADWERLLNEQGDCTVPAFA